MMFALVNLLSISIVCALFMWSLKWGLIFYMGLIGVAIIGRLVFMDFIRKRFNKHIRMENDVRTYIFFPVIIVCLILVWLYIGFVDSIDDLFN